MKKIISIVLSVCLLCALFVTPALAGAAYNSDVTVSAALDKTELTTSSSAQTVELTIKTSKKVDLFSIGYKVQVPTGWSITGIESGSTDIGYSLDDGHYSLSTGVVSWYKAENKSTNANGTIGKITISVPANAEAKSYTINVTGIELGTKGENNNNAWMSNGIASAQLTIKAPPVALTGTATITGTAKYGQILTAGLTDGNNTGTLSYKWFRGDSEISGATGSTYTLAADDIGKAIKVEISSSVQTGSKTSSPTSAVAKADGPAAPSCTFSFDGTNAGKLMSSTTTMEYSLNGGSSWTSCSASDVSLTVANITAENDIKVRVKETTTTSAGAAQTIDITKASKPTTVGKTDCTTFGGNDGTITGVNNTMEYKKSDGSTWIAISGGAVAVTGLGVGTYLVRVKAAGTKLASEATSVEITAFTAIKEQTPTATFTATGDSTGTLSNVTNGMKYSTNNGASWTDITSTSVDLTGLSAGTIKVYMPGNGTTTTDSNQQTINVSKASTPNLTVTQPTTVGGTGSVATTTAHQFSTNGTSWTDCTGTKTGLAVGTYYVRVKATGTTLASAAQTVSITAFNPNKEQTPAASFTATGDSTGTLSNVTSGMKYSTNGGSSWTNITSTSVSLTGLSAGTIKIYKPGNGTTTTDSDQQTINVSKASTPNLTVTQPTTVGGTGSVATTTAHQFSENGTTWTDCTGAKTGLAAGTYYVRVKATGTTLASAAQTVTITAFTPVSVTNVSLNKSSTTIKVGNSETLTATVTPTNATNKNVTWSSSNTSVATINQNGRVTGVAEGTATITVTTADGSKTATCSVTVEKSSTPVTPPTTDQYSIDAPSNVQNGSLTVDKNSATVSSLVTITASPDEGYKLNALTVKDAKGSALTLTKVNDTTYTFKMPASKVTISATFVKIGACALGDTCPAAKFTDLDLTAWYHDGVHFCVENKYMQGVAEDKFDPVGTTSRAMIVTILWRMEGCPVVDSAMSFKDVPADLWYTKAISWAQSTGIVEGYSVDTFGPDDPITREQMATILYRYAKHHNVNVANTNALEDFDDVNKVSTWALDAMKWANAVGLVQGRTTTTLVPEADITRAEAATMVQRYCEAFQK